MVGGYGTGVRRYAKGEAMNREAEMTGGEGRK